MENAIRDSQLTWIMLLVWRNSITFHHLTDRVSVCALQPSLPRSVCKIWFEGINISSQYEERLELNPNSNAHKVILTRQEETCFNVCGANYIIVTDECHICSLYKYAPQDSQHRVWKFTNTRVWLTNTYCSRSLPEILSDSLDVFSWNLNLKWR